MRSRAEDIVVKQTIARGDALRKEGKTLSAIETYLELASRQEIPEAELCLRLARCYARMADNKNARRWLLRVVDAEESFTSWLAAASLLAQLPVEEEDCTVKRRVKSAILGSYTTTQLVPLLRLAARRERIALSTYECAYGQYRQEILDAESELYRFQPDVVILAVHSGELALPAISDSPAEHVASELERWTSLWRTLGERTAARIIQHNFASPYEVPLGHLSARLPGSRYAMIGALNAALGEAAGTNVSIVDCERLSALCGKAKWFDDKYWCVSKQAVALGALPMLARHTVSVLAADLGLTRKCLALDLDNTLWGGIIGEDGLHGIALGPGGGPVGEAYAAFQEYIRNLKDKGIILAVSSRNNEADAREPFERHPAMRLRLDDFAIFIANWEPKAENLRTIAETLNIGLDSLVFVDDNPAERELIRQRLPEVDVIALPEDPAHFVRTLSDYLMFESSTITPEDARRTEQYRARAQMATLRASANTMQDFYRSLRMKAVVAPFDELHLPRIVQLIGKTNQFNLTTRRYTLEQIRKLTADPNCAHFHLTLQDRFGDHGLVSLMIAFKSREMLDIDTWLMSCRVIGRTIEAEMLAHLCRAAARLNCTVLRGTYIPTAKNHIVKNVYGPFGFTLVRESSDGTTEWTYDLAVNGPISNQFICTEIADREWTHDAA